MADEDATRKPTLPSFSSFVASLDSLASTGPHSQNASYNPNVAVGPSRDFPNEAPHSSLSSSSSGFDRLSNPHRTPNPREERPSRAPPSTASTSQAISSLPLRPNFSPQSRPVQGYKNPETSRHLPVVDNTQVLSRPIPHLQEDIPGVIRSSPTFPATTSNVPPTSSVPRSLDSSSTPNTTLESPSIYAASTSVNSPVMLPGRSPSGGSSSSTYEPPWRVLVTSDDPRIPDAEAFEGEIHMEARSEPPVTNDPVLSTTVNIAGPDGRVAKWPCSHCGKRFSRPSSRDIHENIHTGARPFTCTVPGCDRTFSVLSNMRRHTKTHGTQNPGAPLPSSAKRRQGPRQHKSTKASTSNVDDELIDELEGESSSETAKPQRRSQSKRRKVADQTPVAEAGPSHPAGSSRSGSDSPASTMRAESMSTSVLDASGSDDDGLDQLLGDGQQRRGRGSPVYTSSDASGEEDDGVY